MNAKLERQLRAIAEIIATGPSPAVSAQLAILQTAILDEALGGGNRTSLDPARAVADPTAATQRDEHITVARAPEPAHVQPVQPPVAAHVQPETSTAPPPAAHVQPEHGTSTTCEPSTLHPLLSSPDLKNQEKKNAHHRPFADDPLPDDLRRVYDEVVAERRVALPSPEFVWAKWVEFLWAKNQSFATRWTLKRAWRTWLTNERAVERPAPAPAETTAAAPAPTKARAREPAQQGSFEPSWLSPEARETSRQLARALVFFDRPELAKAPVDEVAPEPRSLSA